MIDYHLCRDSDSVTGMGWMGMTGRTRQESDRKNETGMGSINTHVWAASVLMYGFDCYTHTTFSRKKKTLDNI